MAELTPEQRKLFEGKNFAVVGTVGKDGGPRGTAVWVDIDDAGNILLNSRIGRGWPANVRRDPRVTVTVIDHDDPYRKVTVEGHVVESTTEGARDHINKLAKKYRGHDEYGHPEHQRILFRVAPDRIHTYGL